MVEKYKPKLCCNCAAETGLLKWNGVVACEDCIRLDIRDTDQIEDAIDEYIQNHARSAE